MSNFRNLKQTKQICLIMIIMMIFLSLNVKSSKSKQDQNQKNKDNNKNSSEDDFYEYFRSIGELSDEFTSNPYYDLGIGAWSTFKDVKTRYRELIKKYHPDKSGKDTQAKFMKIQKAFEKIKKQRKIDNDEDDYEEGKETIIIKIISDGSYKIASMFIALFIFKTFMQYCFRFLEFIWFKIVLYYLSYWIIDTFLSHLIRNYSHIQVYSILLTLLINYIFNRFIFNRKAPEAKNENVTNQK